MNKYGIEHFHFEVLEETNNPNEREMYYIQLYNSYHMGYNETFGGDGTTYLVLPEEDICKYYLQTKSLSKTGQYFNCDKKTVDKILYKNNISQFEFSEVMKANSSNKKAVAQLDKNTLQIIKTYPSISEAERQNSCNGHIREVCQGKRKSAGGYSWKYV